MALEHVNCSEGALLSTRKVMTEQEACRLGEDKGGMLGKILIRKKMTSLELLYFPFYLVSIKTGYKVRVSKIPEMMKVVVDGTSGRCALVNTEPNLQPLCVDAKKESEHFSLEEVIRYASKHANRYLIRVRRNAALFKEETATTFYRPYWVAFYGDRSKEKRIWYLPFEADGYSINYA